MLFYIHLRVGCNVLGILKHYLKQILKLTWSSFLSRSGPFSSPECRGLGTLNVNVPKNTAKQHSPVATDVFLAAEAVDFFGPFPLVVFWTLNISSIVAIFRKWKRKLSCAKMAVLPLEFASLTTMYARTRHLFANNNYYFVVKMDNAGSATRLCNKGVSSCWAPILNARLARWLCIYIW